MGCMEEQRQWICIHTSNSPFEANLIRSFLENAGIEVNLCTPFAELHSYIHDREENIRIFVPIEDMERGKCYTQQLMRYNRIKSEFEP